MPDIGPVSAAVSNNRYTVFCRKLPTIGEISRRTVIETNRGPHGLHHLFR